METEKTLALVKPDGVEKGLIGECIRQFQKQGLELKEVRIETLTLAKARKLYKKIREKYPKIYKSLLNYMTKGTVAILILEGEDAAEKARKTAGPTNPKEAPKGTIRGDYAKGDMKELYKQGKATKNIIHTSENAKEARKEIKIINK